MTLSVRLLRHGACAERMRIAPRNDRRECLFKCWYFAACCRVLH